MVSLINFRTIGLISLLFLLSQNTYGARQGKKVPEVQDRYFSQSKEFPNYFLSEKYRTPGAVSPEDLKKEISRVKNLLEDATHNILMKMTVPIATGENKEVQMVDYFSYLPKEIEAIDKTAKLMPSGGVVRSVIGYEYKEMFDGMHRNPPVSPEETLKRLASKSSESIPAYKVRGVGSDFDVLIQGDPDKFEAVKKRVEEITNSAESKFGARGIRGDFKRSLFTIGDVKGYDGQIARSTNQGGATTDFLAFDMKTGKFVEPTNMGGIIDSLVQGHYSYLAPVEGYKVEDEAKQIIRGMRPLLELPFLELENDAQFRKELTNLLHEVTNGRNPSDLDKALSQFDKMVRNARESGAHNRFHRGGPDSIEELIGKVSKVLEEKTGRATIPEFVDKFPLEFRNASKSELNGLPKHLLTKPDGPKGYIARFTNEGKLFHGTPNLDNGMAIMRGGIFLSKPGGRIHNGSHTGTTAAFGEGGYSSKFYTTSQGYAGANGVVFELSVKNDQRVNFLDWESPEIQNDPFIKSLIAKAEKENISVFSILRKEHGIDFINNSHILIQNLDAVDLPSDFKTLLNAFGTVIDNHGAAASARIKAYSEYLNLYEYSQALGEKGVKAPIAPNKFVKQMLDVPIAERLAVVQGFNSSNPQILVESLREDKFLLKQIFEVPVTQRIEIMKVLLSNNQSSAIINDAFLANPTLKSDLRNSMHNVENREAELIKNFPWNLDDEEDFKLIVKILKEDPNKGYLREYATFNSTDRGKDLLQQVMKRDKALKDSYREIVRAGLKKDVFLIHTYRWDLTDEEDLKLFKQILTKATPESQMSLRKRFNTLEAKLGEIYPRLAQVKSDHGYYGRGRNNEGEIYWGSYPAKKIKNPYLRSRLETLQVELHYADNVERMVDQAFSDNPTTYIKNFPDMGDFKSIKVIDYTKEKITIGDVWGHIAEDSNYGDLTKSILSRTAKGNRVKLSSEDFKLIEFLFDRGDKTVAATLLHGRSEVRDYLLNRLKTLPPEKQGRVLDYFLDVEKNDNPAVVALKNDVNEFLKKQIAKDKNWRTSIRDNVIKEGQVDRLKKFTWNLADKEDVVVLTSLAKNRTSAKAKLDEIANHLYHTERVNWSPDRLKWNTDQLDPLVITNPEMRAEFIKARNNYITAKNVDDSLLPTLQKQDPKEFRAAIPESKLNQRNFPYNNSDERPIVGGTEMDGIISRWNETGYNSLTQSEKKMLAKIRNLPIDEDGVWFFRSLLKSGKETRAWASERILNFKKEDTLHVITDIVREDNGLLSELQRNAKYSKFKSAIRERVMLSPPSTLKDLEKIPWDFRSQEDIAVLRKLNETFSHGGFERAEDVGDAIGKKFPKLKGNYNWENYPVGEIQDPRLAKRLEVAQAHEGIRSDLNRVFRDMFEQNPKLFVSEFPNEDTGISHGRLKLSKQGSPVIDYSSEKSEIKKTLDALIKKIAKGSKATVTDEDFKLIKFFIRNDNFTDVAFLGLTGRKPVKDFILKTLREDHESSMGAVFELLKEHFDYDNKIAKIRTDARKIIVDELNKDPIFRNTVRTAIAKYQKSSVVRDFPWDLKNSGDVAALKSWSSPPKDLEQRKRVIKNVLAQKGIDVSRVGSFDDISDPNIKKLMKDDYYTEQRQSYVKQTLAKLGTDSEKLQNATLATDREQVLEHIRQKLSQGGVCETH
jgi:hypothetical protein